MDLYFSKIVQFLLYEELLIQCIIMSVTEYIASYHLQYCIILKIDLFDRDRRLSNEWFWAEAIASIAIESIHIRWDDGYVTAFTHPPAAALAWSHRQLTLLGGVVTSTRVGTRNQTTLVSPWQQYTGIRYNTTTRDNNHLCHVTAFTGLPVAYG